MPNYATNYAALVGEPEQLDALITRVIATPGKPAAMLDFERIIPCPPELRETISPVEVVDTQQRADVINAQLADLPHMEGQASIKAITRAEADRREALYGAGPRGPVYTWYDFCLKYWGTKWPITGASTFQRTKPGQLNLVFVTAWSAPDGIYHALETTFGVQVHARAIIEGGFDDETYGDPEDYLIDTRTIEFR